MTGNPEGVGTFLSLFSVASKSARTSKPLKSLTTEIERNLVSQRTKEALIRKRAEGVILGHPKGRKSSQVKLIGREDDILRLLKRGLSKTRIARRLKVHRITLAKFIRDQRLTDSLSPH